MTSNVVLDTINPGDACGGILNNWAIVVENQPSIISFNRINGTALVETSGTYKITLIVRYKLITTSGPSPNIASAAFVIFKNGTQLGRRGLSTGSKSFGRTGVSVYFTPTGEFTITVDPMSYSAGDVITVQLVEEGFNPPLCLNPNGTQLLIESIS